MANTFGLLCFSVGGTPWIPPSTPPAPGERQWLPEIHLNIWELKDSGNKFWSFKKPPASGKGSAFLDIGLMLDLNEPATSIELIFPWAVAAQDILDLSQQISKQDAIPAIFNESWATSHQQLDCVVSDPTSQKPSFAIVSTENALAAKKHQVHDAISIDVKMLKARAIRAGQHVGKAVEKVYARIRILNIERDFYCVGAGEPKDRWWSPSWQRTEVIDLRLNVRRGAPTGLENSVGGPFTEFSKVHLFLMRSREQDIVFQDVLFKASRSLEDEKFWATYSLLPVASPAELNSNLERVKKSLGYQWTKKGAPVAEFGTLARFKIVEFGVQKFVIVALLMGAFGNALWDGVKFVFFAVHGEAAVAAVCTNIPETSVVVPRADCPAPAKTDPAKGPRTGVPANK